MTPAAGAGGGSGRRRRADAPGGSQRGRAAGSGGRAGSSGAAGGRAGGAAGGDGGRAGGAASGRGRAAGGRAGGAAGRGNARTGGGQTGGGRTSRRSDSGDLLAPSPRSGDRRRNHDTSELGGEQVEGRHAVRELLAAHRRPIRQVWLAEGLDRAPILDDIATLATAGSVPVRTVNSARLRQVALTEAPQGVVAFADPLAEADLDELASYQPGGPPPFLIVVDGLTDPHNLGALLRTAQCAGATGAVLARHRSVHVTATVAKAAAGAIEYLPMAVVPGIPTALARLADAGVWTVGLDARAPEPLWNLRVASEPIAIVLGAEGAGLSRLAKARCQLLVAIPQAGPLASLNVAAAGALACFEVSRARAAPVSDS